MTEKEATRVSKFLSLILRHEPQKIGLVLDSNGWANVAELIEKANSNGMPIHFGLLDDIVKTNPKKRFAFNDDRTKVRASQGHSIPIDLAYEPQSPPAVLYHGTALQHLDSILENGLQKQSRHHVHLSDNRDTARAVGQRHGKPVVLRVSAATMQSQGFLFFRSENDVWLTDEVPPQFIAAN